MAHSNDTEPFCAMLKSGCQGTCHEFSEKHLDRYVGEFGGRHDFGGTDTEDRMAFVARQTVGQCLRYRELIADSGPSSGARAAA